MLRLVDSCKALCKQVTAVAMCYFCESVVWRHYLLFPQIWAMVL